MGVLRKDDLEKAAIKGATAQHQGDVVRIGADQDCREKPADPADQDVGDNGEDEGESGHPWRTPVVMPKPAPVKPLSERWQ